MECATRGCHESAKTPRAAFCSDCFTRRCARGGRKSSGNTTTGKRKRSAGRKSGGNTTAGKSKRSAGRKGGKASSGNTTTGERRRRISRDAGTRSGKRRSAKLALVVKKCWLDKILAGEKDWEIRGSATKLRGPIHFGENAAGGKLVGRARLVDSLEIPRASFMEHIHRHCVKSMREVPYTTIFAWVLEKPERFRKPFVYKHPPGAVTWVRV